MEGISTDLDSQKSAIESFLETKALEGFPENLSDAVRHIMTLEGKRLRPMMVLTTAQAFGVEQKEALSAAVSIEVFHNFTLVHDDIMDKAKLRRGKATVHEKFGTDKAIVTGDAMLPHAVGLLIQDHADKATPLLHCFNKMGKEVMEGQQSDMDFENRQDVALEEYMQMIKLKTSVVFGAACEIGAIMGDATAEDRHQLYRFGLYSGLAFQIMDDYLDTFGDEHFGKRIGGDILLNKKTFLLVDALEKASSEQRKRLVRLFEEPVEDKKIAAFQELYRELKVPQSALERMEQLHRQSLQALSATSLKEDDKQHLRHLGEVMLKRRR